MHIRYNATSDYWEYLSAVGPPEVWTQLPISGSVITIGTIDAARIPSLDASKITTGEFSQDRIPTLAWTKVSKTGSSLADLATKSAAALDSGTLADGRLSSNVPLKDVANVFTANQRINTTYGFAIGAITGVRRIQATTDTFTFLTDADGYGSIAAQYLTLYGGNIVFPASQNASGDVHTLDDYEEGTWTPVIGGTGGESGQTYSGQYGKYIKIGKLVHAQFYVTLSAKGTITNYLTIKGLPFTSDSGYYSGMSMGHASMGTGATAIVALSGNVELGTTRILLRMRTAAAVSDSLPTTSDITNDASFLGSVVYVADA